MKRSQYSQFTYPLFLLLISCSPQALGFSFPGNHRYQKRGLLFPSRLGSLVTPLPSRRRQRYALSAISHNKQNAANPSRTPGPPLNNVLKPKGSTQNVLDRIIDQSLRAQVPSASVMSHFDAEVGKTLWRRRWKGTALGETRKSSLRSTLWAIAVYLGFLAFPPLQQAFDGFHLVWAPILGVTTLSLSLFLHQSYEIWSRTFRKCQELQGRLSDLLLLAAGYAQRTDDQIIAGSGATALRRTSISEFTPASRKVLQICGRHTRLYTLFLYASLTKAYRPLLTPLGLRRLMDRGLLTSGEFKILQTSTVPSRHNVVLMWMFRTMVQASKVSSLDGGVGMEHQLIGVVQEIRGLTGGLESVVKGGMPLAYAHVVQLVSPKRFVNIHQMLG